MMPSGTPTPRPTFAAAESPPEVCWFELGVVVDKVVESEMPVTIAVAPATAGVVTVNVAEVVPIAKV
jgi:hypothetical protein